ncbi:hypothetical protein [Formosa algae]|uniref:hypothetical protein n=1 Tax=Formosa algae TaxID=225843 RepID=UPI000CCE06F1|nr:hypothetical protein [Formosa algae]PNW26852.1 hypothetical protein BKP44_15325 [Formosa algae]
MKKIYYLILLFLTISTVSYGQNLEIASQSFNSSAADTWGIFYNSPSFGSNPYIFDYVSSITNGTDIIGTVGGSDNFLGVKYGNNVFPPIDEREYSLYFDTFTLNDASKDHLIEFDYEYIASSSTYVPDVTYTIYNESYTPLVSGTLLTTGTSPATGIATESISLPKDTYTYSSGLTMVLFISYPTGTIDAEWENTLLKFDDFKIYENGFDGYVYNSGVWTAPTGYPAAPDATTGSIDALIASGTYTISSEVDLSSLIINSDSYAIIEATGSLNVTELTTNDNLTINSNSSQFGSLIVDGSVTGSTTYNKHVNSQPDNDFISAPVTGQTFGSFASANSNIPSTTGSNIKFFGPWDRTTGSYVTWTTTGNSNRTLDPGIGYRTGSTDNGTFSFTGTVNTSSVSVDVYHKGDTPASQWNLIGNPYPSYVSLYDFIDYNNFSANGADILQVSRGGLYGYNAALVDYWTVYNLANTIGDSNIMAPGQAFYIAVDNDLTGVMTFNPDMRINGSGDDFIPGRINTYNKRELILSLSSDDVMYHTNELYFFDDIVTLGLDNGWDTAIYGNNDSGYTLYSQLVESNSSYKMAIQSLPNSSITEEGVTIALGLIASANKQLTLDIKETTFGENVEVYLEDIESEDSWTLLNDQAYTFTTTEKLNGTGRFYLHISENKTLSIDDENAIESLKFYTGNKTIKIKGSLEANTTLTVYDIQGRKINNIALKKCD